ncbi:MAG TPA: hypothetical protein VK658_01045 [Chryseolinea sp.]|nr:hypothetical protein [Chryseolinea sp.]
MIEHNAVNDFNAAEKFCIDDLMTNRYMRIELIDMRDRALDKKLSDQTRDSTLQFVDSFTSYVESNCCKEIGLCDADSTVSGSVGKSN